jgi:hypothetical protein
MPDRDGLRDHAARAEAPAMPIAVIERDWMELIITISTAFCWS